MARVREALPRARAGASLGSISRAFGRARLSEALDGEGSRSGCSSRGRGRDVLACRCSRDEFPATYPCHVTLPVRRDIPALRKGKIIREVEAAFRRACSRPDFRLVHYSIQDDTRT